MIMKTFKFLIVLLLIVCFKNTMAQKTNKKRDTPINKVLISKIKEEADSLYKHDIFIYKRNLKPVYVLYIQELDERKNSFVFSMTTMLNHYELKGTNSSHKFCFSNKIMIIRYNHKTINPTLIDEVFEKISMVEIDSLSKELLKSINGGQIVGPRYAVVYKYKKEKYIEKWYDNRNTLPIELDYLDNEFINYYNKMLLDSINKVNEMNEK